MILITQIFQIRLAYKILQIVKTLPPCVKKIHTKIEMGLYFLFCYLSIIYLRRIFSYLITTQL
jgi:hypothetical protein